MGDTLNTYESFKFGNSLFLYYFREDKTELLHQLWFDCDTGLTTFPVPVFKEVSINNPHVENFICFINV